MNISDDFVKRTRECYNFRALNESPDFDEIAMLKLVSQSNSVLVPYMAVKRVVRNSSHEFSEFLREMIVDSVVLNGKTIYTFVNDTKWTTFKSSCFEDTDGLRQLFDDVLQHKTHN